MKEVKWGVMGLGEQAMERMIPAMTEAAGACLCCVCSSSEEKAKTASEACPDARYFREFDEFLANEEMEAVYIATPHHLHVPHAFQALGAGKHVLVEKPLSLSVDGARKLVEAARQREVVLGVGYQLHQHPGLKALKQMVENDELGEMEMMMVNLHHPATWEQSWRRETMHTGPISLMHLGVHVLDLLLWLKKEPAEEVVTSARVDESQDGIVDAISMIVSFRDSAQAIVNVSSRLPGSLNQLVMMGSKAQVSADLEWPPSMRRQTILIKREGGEERKEFEVENLFAKELAAFSKALMEGAEFSPSGSENMPVVELTCAAIESINSKRAVRVGDVKRVSG